MNLDDQAKNLVFQKQTDGASTHKRPKNGKWLSLGGQIGNGHIGIPRHKEKAASKQAI